MKTIFKTYGMMSQKEIEDIKKEILEFCDENASDNDISEFLYRSIDDDYENGTINLDKELDGQIICIADIGRWNGRVKGYKICSNNLKDILGNISCDEYKVYFDGHNVKAEGYHHDGRNSVEYREIKNDRCIEKFTDMIYSGAAITRQVINYYTKSLGKYVKEIYGW